MSVSNNFQNSHLEFQIDSSAEQRAGSIVLLSNALKILLKAM